MTLKASQVGPTQHHRGLSRGRRGVGVQTPAPLTHSRARGPHHLSGKTGWKRRSQATSSGQRELLTVLREGGPREDRLVSKLERGRARQLLDTQSSLGLEQGRRSGPRSPSTGICIVTLRRAVGREHCTGQAPIHVPTPHSLGHKSRPAQQPWKCSSTRTVQEARWPPRGCAEEGVDSGVLSRTRP